MAKAKGRTKKGKRRARRVRAQAGLRQDRRAARRNPGAGRRGAPRFVVQEHSARRLHWDLRLEHDGVAASWAIPNGIPEDPAENRKAVHTEDHPLEYLDWEGEIPAGEYGAGTMKIWDAGTYELEKWEPEKVMVELPRRAAAGPLRAVPRRQERQGLDDPPDRPARPASATRSPRTWCRCWPGSRPCPRDADGWAVEVKWDGVRAIAYCRPGRRDGCRPATSTTSPPSTRRCDGSRARARLLRRGPRRRAGRLRRRGPAELRAAAAADRTRPTRASSGGG